MYVATNLQDFYTTDDRNFKWTNTINISELTLDNQARLLHVKNGISTNWNLARNIFACQVHDLFVPNKNPRDEISQNKHFLHMLNLATDFLYWIIHFGFHSAVYFYDTKENTRLHKLVELNVSIIITNWLASHLSYFK